MNKTPQGTWLSRAQNGSLWLCYAGPLAGRRKVESRVISEDQSRFPGSRTVGKLGNKEDEEKKPETERRREYTDLGLDLGDRKEQIACHVSALALAMTN